METGVGSEQHWGLCPGLRASSCQGISPDLLECALFVDMGDLRYLFANICDIVRATKEGKQCRVFLYERHTHLLCKLIVKIILLLLIGQETDVNSKIELAHCYSEIHGNTFISADAKKLLISTLKIALALFSPGYRSKLSDAHKKVYLAAADILDFRSYLKRGDQDDFYSILYSMLDECTAKQAAPSDGKTVYRKTSHTLTPGIEKVEAVMSPGDAFDKRLRDFYLERYDVRANVCMWDKHMHLASRLAVIHDPFFQSFRTSGISYLRAYYRGAAALGNTEEALPVARRAATTQESKMYCGEGNPLLLSRTVEGSKVSINGYRGDILLGPWFEVGYNVHYCFPDYFEQILKPAMYRDATTTVPSVSDLHELKNPEEFELYRVYSPTGPSSFEGIFSSIEISVFNLCVCSSLLWELVGAHSTLDSPQSSGPIILLTGDFGSRVGTIHKTTNLFTAVFLSIEGCRLLQSPDVYYTQLKPCLRKGAGHVLITELGQYVLRLQRAEVPLFKDKLKRQLISCGYQASEATAVLPFFNKYPEKEQTEAMGTHLIAIVTAAKTSNLE
ncbi:Hypothetical protein GLP15_1763 [Giardia lamblia P15]|uniref:Dynein assembly factor 3 C-terminal domain-containing protein n=1 Tax=Giardia intestinalis (strain P15) TaxID=658858 RepID=E1F793_GIAIA|nr:Hypothetical protein GLP15_1763 [Giardia lamblia P15]